MMMMMVQRYMGKESERATCFSYNFAQPDPTRLCTMEKTHADGRSLNRFSFLFFLFFFSIPLPIPICFLDPGVNRLLVGTRIGYMTLFYTLLRKGEEKKKHLHPETESLAQLDVSNWLKKQLPLQRCSWGSNHLKTPRS